MPKLDLSALADNFIVVTNQKVKQPKRISRNRRNELISTFNEAYFAKSGTTFLGDLSKWSLTKLQFEINKLK